MKDLLIFERPAALGLNVRQFLDTLEEQIGASLIAAGCALRSTSTGIALLLHNESGLSVADIAARLRISHQLTTQRVGWVVDNGFAGLTRDPADGHRQLVALTAEGRRECGKLESHLVELDRAYNELFAEIEINLCQAVRLAEKALQARPLAVRIDAARS
jgi:DNA-binding MarR family transcriptional regulator